MPRKSVALQERAAQRDPRVLAPLVLAVVAAGLALPIGLGGGIVALHAVAIVLAPVALAFAWRHRIQRWIWITAVVWCVAQLAVDVALGVPPSALVLLGPLIALTGTGLYWASSRYEIRVETMGLFFGLGWLGLELSDFGSLAATGNPWKYGLSAPITVIALCAAWRTFGSHRVSVGVLFALAAVSFSFDSRFTTAIYVVSALVVLLGATPAARVRRTRVLIILVAAVVAAYIAYPAVALSGALGDRAQVQQQQYERTDANYLLATRKELPQMAFIIAQTIPFGIGSNQPVDPGVSTEAIAWVDEHVTALSPNDVYYLLDPPRGLGYHPHSQIATSVLYCGLLALPFWIAIYAGSGRLALRESRGASPVPGLGIYIAGTVVWSSLFSPITDITVIALGFAVFVFACSTDRPQAAPGATTTPPPGASRHRRRTRASRASEGEATSETMASLGTPPQFRSL